MRLSRKQIVIDAGKAITLKPTLRAAFRLAADYGSLEQCYKDVCAGYVTAFADVIKAGAGTSTPLTDYIDGGNALPINVCLNLWVKPVVDFLLELHGPQEESPVDCAIPRDEKRMTENEFHNRLFAIATGYLNWSAEQAWDATPDEILVAYEALTEKLRAIHGGGEKETPVDLTKMEADERRAQLSRLAAIGDLRNHTMPA